MTRTYKPLLITYLQIMLLWPRLSMHLFMPCLTQQIQSFLKVSPHLFLLHLTHLTLSFLPPPPKSDTFPLPLILWLLDPIIICSSQKLYIPHQPNILLLILLSLLVSLKPLKVSIGAKQCLMSLMPFFTMVHGISCHQIHLKMWSGANGYFV